MKYSEHIELVLDYHDNQGNVRKLLDNLLQEEESRRNEREALEKEARENFEDLPEDPEIPNYGHSLEYFLQCIGQQLSFGGLLERDKTGKAIAPEF